MAKSNLPRLFDAGLAEFRSINCTAVFPAFVIDYKSVLIAFFNDIISEQVKAFVEYSRPLTDKIKGQEAGASPASAGQ